jgi:hypothetical protein
VMPDLQIRVPLTKGYMKVSFGLIELNIDWFLD